MRTEFKETAPCANAIDILAVQACKQVLFANHRLELQRACSFHLQLVQTHEVNMMKSYLLIDNPSYNQVELWKLNDQGDRVCMLLAMKLVKNNEFSHA